LKRKKGQKKWGVRSYTKYQVLLYLREKGKATVEEIAQVLGLSRSTVYTLLEYYKGQRLVRQLGVVITGKRGRDATLWGLTRKGLRDIERLKRFYAYRGVFEAC